MGNSISFGVTRDKDFKAFEIDQPFSESVEKYDVLFMDYANESTNSQSKYDFTPKNNSEFDIGGTVNLRFAEIESYCREVKFSIGWENIGVTAGTLENFRVIGK